TYTITQGENMDKFGTYTGKVTIENVKGDVNRLKWQLDTSGPSSGLGFVVDNTLCAGFSPDGNVGVAVYLVDGGTLTGQWLNYKTDGNLGKEVLAGPPGLEGV